MVKESFHTVPSGCEGCVLGDSGHGPQLQCGEEGERFGLGADSEVVRLGTPWMDALFSWPFLPSQIQRCQDGLRDLWGWVKTAPGLPQW